MPSETLPACGARGLFGLRSLRARLLLLLLIAVLPVLALLVHTAFEQRQLAQAAIEDDAARLAGQLAISQENLIVRAQELLLTISKLPAMSSGPAACNAQLAQLLPLYPQYMNLVVANPNGDLYCSARPSSKPVNVAKVSSFTRAVEARGFALGDFQVSAITNTNILTAALAARDEAGEVRFVAAAVLSLDWMSAQAARTPLPDGAVLAVLDRDGVVLVRHPEPGKWVGKPGGKRPEYQRAVAEGEGIFEAPGLDGVERIFAVKRMEGIPAPASMNAVAGLSKRQAFADIDRALARNLGWLAAIAAVALLSAWFGARVLVLKPADAILKATRRLRAGELSSRIGAGTGGGELQQVAVAFDEMAAILQDREVEHKRSEQELRRAHGQLRQLIDNLFSFVGVLTAEGTLVEVNETALRAANVRRKDVLDKAVEDSYWIAYSEESRARMREAVRRAAGGEPVRDEIDIRVADGHIVTIDFALMPVRDETGLVTRLIASGVDITERKRTETLRAEQSRVLGMIAVGSPLEDSLLAVARFVETHSPQVLASILLLDQDGLRVRHAAAPRLPDSFTREIDGQPIGERAGSCGTAAYRRAAVIVEDIAIDPLWEDYRALALAHGLRACWSTPIFDAPGKVLGTFALYTRQPARPTAEQLRLIDMATDTAAIAIGRERAEHTLRQSSERLQMLSRRLLEVQEEERATIARELHDEIGQSLTALKLGMQGLARKLVAADAAKLAECVAIADQSLAQMRNLALDLRPPQLDQLGLDAALHDYVERIAAGAGFRPWFSADREFRALDKQLATAAFRVAQEALTNVARHAAARNVTVELRQQGSELILAVSDDGRGYDLAQARRRALKGGSMGILGMEERVALAGGRLSIETRPGRGTRVQAAFPLGPDAVLEPAA